MKGIGGYNMKRVLCLIGLALVLSSGLFAQALPRLAVVEFSKNTNNEKISVDAITVREIVESEMVKTRKYQIITREDIDKLLENQRIQVSSISSAENLQKLELQNINYIVTGSLSAMGNDYAITVRVLNVSTGQFSHSENDFMGSGSRELYAGIMALMAKFAAGMAVSEGGAIVQASGTPEKVAPAIAIEVSTVEGGDLYFQGQKIATLWDNDTQTIPIESPGTYALQMKLVNGNTKTASVIITARGVSKVDFSTIALDPPQNMARNLRSGTVGTDSITLIWDSSGSGLSYKVYYDSQNNPAYAKTNVVYRTSTAVTGLTSNTTYYFWVSTVQEGRESEKSPVLSVKTTAPLPPAISMVRINGGTFTMGSPASEPERNSNETQHQVTVSSFFMGKYEVTQAEYQAVMGSNPSTFTAGNFPVEKVSWYDAIEYCNRLSQMEGLTPAYTVGGTSVTWNRDASGYRLPTEAEWEYACRAGTTTPFNTGNNITTSQANYNGNDPYNNNAKGIFRAKTTIVGSFAANQWGLYDMHGNVHEWCWDMPSVYPTANQTDPVGGASGSNRVIRGGSLYNGGQYLRSAIRFSDIPSLRRSDIGFRLVRN